MITRLTKNVLFSKSPFYSWARPYLIIHLFSNSKICELVKAVRDFLFLFTSLLSRCCSFNDLSKSVKDIYSFCCLRHQRHCKDTITKITMLMFFMPFMIIMIKGYLHSVVFVINVIVKTPSLKSQCSCSSCRSWWSWSKGKKAAHATKYKRRSPRKWERAMSNLHEPPFWQRWCSRWRWQYFF